ncbi:hypothetical protein M885DRAFT_509419 [Pelagophyceae sp. CCMP2097]|nr:hypothetical protein M885DRAFT_509419 [Pelagophyceae sp. CCMP2097]
MSAMEASIGVEAQLVDLWRCRDAFFATDPARKKELLQQRVDGVLRALEASPAKGADQRARAAYVKGRALDASEAFSAEAEAELSRALKLAPGDAEAWAALGHALWKKRDIEMARDCFAACLDRAPANVVALRSLSMLARAVPKNAPAKGAAPAEDGFDLSVRLAKAAVAADYDDAESWYVLGNAQVARFFNDGRAGRNAADLRGASKAYARADGKYTSAAEAPLPAGFVPSEGRWGNPDLYFNRANLLRYLEDYAPACVDLERAAALDASLGAADVRQDALRWVRRVGDLVRRGAGVKPKRRSELDKSVRDAALEAAARGDAAYARLGDLETTPGGAEHYGSASPNAGRKIVVVIALELRRDTAVPPDALIALAYDGAAEPTCVALSIYDGATERLLSGCRCVIDDPVVVHIPVAREGPDDAAPASYVTIRITDASKITVDGAPLPRRLSGAASSTTQ